MRRNTAAKQLVLELLETAGSALSQDMLEKKIAGRADRVTIYRVLNSFCDDGLTHRIISDEGKAYYALCRGCSEKQHRHDHAHFRCLKCENVECLPGAVSVTLPGEYTIANVNYWISGYCNSCR